MLGAVRIVTRIAAVIVGLHLMLLPVAALAASGWREDARCCCPSVEVCKCPHGNGGNTAPMLRTCGEAGVMVAPAAPVVVTPAAIVPLIAPRPVAMAPAADQTSPPEHWPELETPPF